MNRIVLAIYTLTLWLPICLVHGEASKLNVQLFFMNCSDFSLLFRKKLNGMTKIGVSPDQESDTVLCIVLIQWFLTFTLPCLPEVIVLCLRPPDFKSVNRTEHFSFQKLTVL